MHSMVSAAAFAALAVLSQAAFAQTQPTAPASGQAMTAPAGGPPPQDMRPGFDGMRNGGMHHPPHEAFTACAGAASGQRVSFVTPRGLQATCEQSPEGLVARPDRPPGVGMGGQGMGGPGPGSRHQGAGATDANGTPVRR